jgi:hypothetical protein
VTGIVRFNASVVLNFDLRHHHPMKKLLMLVFIAIGLCADTLAADRTDYPPISFLTPGGGKSNIARDQYVMLVVEAGFISHDNSPIPSDAVVAYVNNLLKAKNAAYLGVHIRTGIKYGEVVRALDALRMTAAKSIGVSMIELSVGRDP